MIRWILFLVLLSTSAIQAADVVISAPPTPVEVREPVDLPVSGLATAELSKVRFGVVPDTARVTTRIDWGGATYLQFWAKAPGKYTVTLSLNEWRRGLDDSFFTAKQAGVPPELLAKHEALIKEYAASFPFKSGSCVVEVAAGVPFPVVVDPIKPPPVDPQSGLAAQLIILRNQRQPKHVPVLLDLMMKYQKGTKPEMFLLDYFNTSPQVQLYVKLKPADAEYPYYFLVDAGGNVLDKGPILDTTEKNVEQIAKFQEK